MKTLHFEISIKAPAKKVWDILWKDASYREWTSVFCEGSYMVSDWKEGGKTLFLDGKKDGMYSTIDQLVDNEVMSFKHLGTVKDGVELAVDAETESWSGAKEVYQLKDVKDHTQLSVDVDIIESHEKYFQENFPRALQKVKELAEK